VGDVFKTRIVNRFESFTHFIQERITMRRSPCGCWYLFGWPELLSFLPIVIGVMLLPFPGKYTTEMTLANGPCASCEAVFLQKLQQHPKVLSVDLTRVCDTHQILYVQSKSRFSVKEFEQVLQLHTVHCKNIRIERSAKHSDSRSAIH
jgi:hypothetical protein